MELLAKILSDKLTKLAAVENEIDNLNDGIIEIQEEIISLRSG